MKFGAAIQKATQCYHGIYGKEKKKKNRARTQTSLDRFLKRVGRTESRKEPEPVPPASDLSGAAACPQLPTADGL